MTTVKTRKELRAEIREYTRKPHLTASCASATLAAVANLVRQARRDNKDVWATLSKYKDDSNPDITGSAIKSGFRAFLLQKQGGRCCYCRCWLPAAGGARPIEHILARDKFGRFSMHFWNLAVVCADCNGGKTNSNWGFAPGIMKYPDASAFQETYHPRFHNYDEHVRFVMVETNQGGISVYVGLTKQGKHLCDAVLERTAAKRALLNNHPQLKTSMAIIKRYRKLVGGISTPALDAFADMLDTRLLELVQK